MVDRGHGPFPRAVLLLRCPRCLRGPVYRAPLRTNERWAVCGLVFEREQGTSCALLIDPEARTVEVYDGDRHWTAAEPPEVTLESINGFRFKVADLFA